MVKLEITVAETVPYGIMISLDGGGKATKLETAVVDALAKVCREIGDVVNGEHAVHLGEAEHRLAN